MESVINEQLALRIALAGKALPEVGVEALLKGLIAALGLPLSEEKLAQLSPRRLRSIVSANERHITKNAIVQACAALNNPLEQDMEAPTPDVTQPMTDAFIRVAVSSNHSEEVNGHFGSCLRFLIYEVDAKRSYLAEVRKVNTSEKGEQRTNDLVDLVRDCDVLFTLSIGGPAAAKVTRAGVHPVAVKKENLAPKLMISLTERLAASPPPWLAQAANNKK